MFASIARLFRALFGAAEGKTDRLTAKLLESPDAIRGIYNDHRRTKQKEYNELRESVAGLIRIRDERKQRIDTNKESVYALQNKAQMCVKRFQETQDEQYKDAYCNFAAQAEELVQKIQQDEDQFQIEQDNIKVFTQQLKDMQQEIENLNQQEREAIVTIQSAKRIRQVNDKLTRIGGVKDTRLLSAVNEAVEQAKAQAKLSGELSGASHLQFEKDLAEEGRKAKLLAQFDQACNFLPAASQESLKEEEEGRAC